MSKYYYWPPHKPQFYFPKINNIFLIISDFYKPYKKTARLYWSVYKKCNFIKNRFVIDRNKIKIPFFWRDIILEDVEIKNYEVILNLGTPGVEQKTSIITLDKNYNKKNFLKLSNKKIPKRLIENESKVLSDLNFIGFDVPRLLNFYKIEDYFLLQVEYIGGNKIVPNKINTVLIDVIKEIINYKKIIIKNDLKYSFAHGDFCPWNMQKKDGRFIIFDWEMAGIYPLGYDLFNFIFQTNFLITRKSAKTILKLFNHEISNFFDDLNTINYSAYISEFCIHKLSQVNIKQQRTLRKKYESLLQLVK